MKSDMQDVTVDRAETGRSNSRSYPAYNRFTFTANMVSDWRGMRRGMDCVENGIFGRCRPTLAYRAKFVAPLFPCLRAVRSPIHLEGRNTTCLLAESIARDSTPA